MLLYRLITAAILIPTTLLVLFYSSAQLFLLLTACVFLAAAWEWSNLCGIKSNTRRFLYVLFILFLMGWMLFIPVRMIYTAGLVWWIVAFIFILSYPTFSGWWGRGVVIRGMMGGLVLIPCWTGLNVLRSLVHGDYAILFLLLLIWGADTFAYFAGKCWGKHKLCPLVSPGKSWEGFFAAILGTTLITVLTSWFLELPQAIWWKVILLSIVTVFFSVVGDLLESMLKRQVGVKDSGRMLPGHGGLLDRIDSLTAAVPVYTVGYLMVSKYFY